MDADVVYSEMLELKYNNDYIWACHCFYSKISRSCFHWDTVAQFVARLSAKDIGDIAIFPTMLFLSLHRSRLNMNL